MDERLAVFDLFTQARRKELQGVANSTRGEQELNDVISQAWIIADDMIKAGLLTDLRESQCQDRLLRELYRYFQDSSSYARRNRTVRLDVNEYEADSLEPHPLMRVLASDSPDPLVQVIQGEEPEEEVRPGDVEIERSHSLAGAYGKLLDFFDRNVRRLAEHLCMSIASVRRRCEHVTQLAFVQRPLPYPLPDDFMPNLWPSPKSQRRARQLTFEFSYQLELEY